MRALLAASIATAVFLSVTALVGVSQMISNFQTYGPSYVETIIINGVTTTTVITWKDSAFTILILLWMITLNILCSKEIYKDKGSSELES